jgi:phage baseplate assembly protein W
MGTEILQPFQLDQNGQIASTSDTNTQIDQHLLGLVSTNPGERVMLPNYGIPTFKYLFSMNSADNQQAFLTSAQNALAAWEPSVTVNLTFNNLGENLYNGLMDLNIDWSTSTGTAASGTLTATVLVGGTVVNN